MTERAQANPGRRTVLGAGAAVLGAAALGLPGTANAAENTPGSADGRSGGNGHRLDLPVPTVIGHRGTSGYRPEHTLGSYQLALDMGAHIIEQDLVPTKDGHLVCRHENDITATTDVSAHPEFASRRTTKTVDGVSLTGWFTEDFTLAELKTLRAKERIPGNRQKNTLYDGRWEVPTFEEVLQWADREGRRRGKQVWLYVETSTPPTSAASASAWRSRLPSCCAATTATASSRRSYSSPSSPPASSGCRSSSPPRVSSCSPARDRSPGTSWRPVTRAPSTIL